VTFKLEEFHRNVPDDALIADLVRVSQMLGKNQITFRDYNHIGKYHSSTVAARFGSWHKALERAGLDRTVDRNIPTEDLFRNIVEVWSSLGRQPKTRDLSGEISRFSSSTYAYRFGSWRNALTKFVQWANDQRIPIEPREQSEFQSRKTPRNVNWRLRAQVLMRDEAKCRLCGATPSHGARLHVDHIVAWSKGGETVLSNLQILCDRCNLGKGDLDAHAQ
jgi:Homing endonuclease associated repeat/HNH endonuclease